MKEIKLEGLDESIYYKKLKNGLDVYLMPYKNKTNYIMHYVTKYGSVNTEFVPYGKKEMIKVPDGIAHFLEHKMFEQEEGPIPFQFAAQSGADCNAMTSYTSTRYLFEGNKGFEENLEYLINYVSSPYFTDENVEKEKGIIIEEIKQYDDQIEWELDNLMRAATYQIDPVRYDIAGTKESVSSITKENLYDCYNSFYQPSNMFMMICGNFDKDKAIEIIEKNEKLNKLNTNNKIKEKEFKEPFEVTNKYQVIERNVANQKLGYTIKIPFDKKEDRYTYSLYLGLLQNLLFGLSSEFRERMRNENKMSSFYCDREHTKDYVTLLFVAETDKPDELKEEIEKYVKNIKIDDKEIERVKKVWISSEVMMIDNIDITLNNMIYDIIEFGRLIPNKTEIFRSLSKEKLEKIIKEIDFTNSSTIIVKPIKK